LKALEEIGRPYASNPGYGGTSPTRSIAYFCSGSRAAGSAAERSDIDIGIEGPAPVPRSALAAIHDELEEAPTLYTIDVVDFVRPGEIPQSGATAHLAMTKSQSLRADFARAVTRLEEALALPKDPIVRDSAIQRF
jgi:predicted nucleotidyltransferase